MTDVLTKRETLRQTPAQGELHVKIKAEIGVIGREEAKGRLQTRRSRRELWTCFSLTPSDRPGCRYLDLLVP